MYRILTANGIEFNVRIVFKGDKYGLRDCLTHEFEDPLVEFYDTQFDFTPHGQFVTRYYASTLLGLDAWGRTTGGLVLDYGVESWVIDAESMDRIRDFVRSVI